MTDNNKVPNDLFATGLEDEDITQNSDEPSSDSGEYVITERYEEPGESKDYIKEEVKNYLNKIKDRDYIELLKELNNYTGKEEVFQALTSYLDKIKNKEEKDFGVSGYDKFNSLSSEDKINYYRLEKLINMICLRYKEDGKAINGLVQEIYDSFDLNLQGIESDVIKLITGYGGEDPKRIEIEIERNKVESELENILNKNENNLNFKQKLIEYGMILTPIAGLAAYMFNLTGAESATAISAGIDATLLALLPYVSYKKFKNSKKIKEKTKEIENLDKMVEDLKDEREINILKYNTGV